VAGPGQLGRQTVSQQFVVFDDQQVRHAPIIEGEGAQAEEPALPVSR
jgi:hypothetical protein